MNVVLDIEANSLNNPSQIWLIVCKIIDSDRIEIFRNLTTDEEERTRFIRFTDQVRTFIGHNILGYDLPHIERLLALAWPTDRVVDTFILSKLIDFPRKGHSVEDYGVEFGLEKIKFNDWTKWSQEMEDYCVRDVHITHRIYTKYSRYVHNPEHHKSIELEHNFQVVVNSLKSNGFAFNLRRANEILTKVNEELETLDKDILDAFPPRARLIREIHPKETKYGSLHKGDFRFVTDGDLSAYNGGPFSRFDYIPFNPASHRQIIDVLANAGWHPVDKTKTHIEAERNKEDTTPYQKYGWRVNETNLETLPDRAPKPARTLAKRILFEARRRSLVEWISLCQDDGRIHGDYQGIGAWTHRMSHQRPNTANIPNEYRTNGSRALLGKELRSLWYSGGRKRLLCGVDAEGIQLRIFAHYIDEKEFTEALVNGKKENKSDPHSLNQRVLGSVCKDRQAAKRFVYALLLGAGISKLAEVLECSERDAREALDRLMERYQGFTRLKKTTIPADAKRGWFVGLDGRRVRIPGETLGERRHLCMSGYLQNGEAIVMKMATLKWVDKLSEYDSMLVNLVHDEWQTETPNDIRIALEVAKIQADSLNEVGAELKLRCPLAGSYWSDHYKDYSIGANWAYTH